MGDKLNEPRRIYEHLWNEFVRAIERNDLELDRHLLNKAQDFRRGLTLVFRPSQKVEDAIRPFLRQLTEAAPGQYFYRPEEFHVTVLSLIPGSENWRDQFHHLTAFQSVIDQVLQRHRRFAINFRGVTASPGAVMIQGFPEDDTLARIRDDLREALRQARLGEQLDARYKIQTAHVTVMRFCNAKLDGKRTLELLKAWRTTDFGEASVEYLGLILGDWYASADTARTLRGYNLSAR